MSGNLSFIGLSLISVSAYLCSSVLLLKSIGQKPTRYRPIYVAWLAVSGHFFAIGLNFFQSQHFNFSFFSTASLVSALVSLLLLLANLTNPVEKLGIVIFPLAALLLSLELLFPEKLRSVQSQDWEMGAHILSSVVAFSLLNIAAVQAILLAVQEKQLRNQRIKKLIFHLPALQTMEKLLFQMISLGLVFLTISLISGIFFIEDLFAQHLVHKTFLSMIAWLIFSLLLIGRWRYGWRGQTAIRFTLAGFMLLLLAYFGSKLVLEIILQRT